MPEWAWRFESSSGHHSLSFLPNSKRFQQLNRTGFAGLTGNQIEGRDGREKAYVLSIFRQAQFSVHVTHRSCQIATLFLPVPSQWLLKLLTLRLISRTLSRHDTLFSLFISFKLIRLIFSRRFTE